jgi:hypothetical protein
MSGRAAKRQRPQNTPSSSGLASQVLDNNHGNGGATTATPAVAPAVMELLWLDLSKSCYDHRASHVKEECSASATAGASNCCQDNKQVPDGCRKFIEERREVLLAVESLHSEQIHSEQLGPLVASYIAQDVAHMCDIYTSALNGVFCPHEPHLSLLGKGGAESK